VYLVKISFNVHKFTVDSQSF